MQPLQGKGENLGVCAELWYRNVLKGEQSGLGWLQPPTLETEAVHLQKEMIN